jgi:hypothetical protein
LEVNEMARKIQAATEVSKALLDKLNEAIAREMQVAIQYMWQHVQWSGVGGFAVHGELCKSSRKMGQLEDIR